MPGLEGEKKKGAWLSQGLTEETFQQCFQGEQYLPGVRPCLVAQKLRDSCWRWLKPEANMWVQVAERVLLEQFVQILPPGGREWVLQHHHETMMEAIQLMGDYLATKSSGMTTPPGMKPPRDPWIVGNFSLHSPYQNSGGLVDQKMPGPPNPEAQSWLPALQFRRPQPHQWPGEGPCPAWKSGRPVATQSPRCPGRKRPPPPKIRADVSCVTILGTGPETARTWNVALRRSGLCSHEHAQETQQS
uniref:SCAN box domain-containing protein n=1 Tax=Terrapene triunguis TaxID=2587831 RepID=A0A674JGQ6_9SAUR